MKRSRSVLEGGVKVRDIARRLTALGGAVCNVRRTGEVRYSHPRIARTVRVNGRKCDATRELIGFVRDVEAVVTQDTQE